MKKLLTILLLISSFSVMGQSTNNTPFRFTSGLGFPITTTAPFAGAGFGWWQPSTLKLAVYNGTVWQNLLTETLAGTTYQPIITPGTTAQYRRGDMTWQTLNTAAVPESGNLYATNARSLAYVLTGYTAGSNTPLTATTTYLDAFRNLQAQVNAKQNLITLTTTGTSGAATFNQSTGALNIPQYTGGGTSYIFSNGLTNSAGTVTLGGNLTGSTFLSMGSGATFAISGGTSAGFVSLGQGTGNPTSIGYSASSGGDRKISFENSQMVVTDAPSSKGLVYAGNYGANFTDRSLITKRYADSVAAAAAGLWTRSGTNAIRPTKTDDAISVTNAAQASQFSTNIDGINGVTIASTTANAAVISNSSAANAPLHVTNNNASGPIALFRSASGANRVIIQPNGDVEVLTIGAGFVLKSPDGTRWRITISDAGVLTTTSL